MQTCPVTSIASFGVVSECSERECDVSKCLYCLLLVLVLTLVYVVVVVVVVVLLILLLL